MRFTRLEIIGVTIAGFLPLFAFAQASCPQLTSNLSFGSLGSDVVQLQQFLIAQSSLAAGNDTGYFGRLTEAAVQQWQSSHGVVSSGSAATTGYGAVGPRTRAALASACTGTSASADPNQSLINSLLAQLKALQDQLAQLIVAKGGGGESGSTSQASCSWNGTTIASGSSVTAYQSSSVAYGSQCVSQTRTCSNGTLSGSYPYSACTVGGTASCTLDGVNVTHGASQTFYSAKTVPFGSLCSGISQSRTCQNGTLSGGAQYQYGSCTVGTASSCAFNNQSVANGASVTAYQSSSVAYGSQCVSQQRSCTNGTLSGSYQYAACVAGAAASCTWNGQTIAHSANVTAYQTSSVASGQSCFSQTRTCVNGTLSGSYTNASCSANAPASCAFNGQTVASGSSVTAYQAATVSSGQTCVSQQRTCTNGTLTGSYLYAACSVQTASSPTATLTANGQTSLTVNVGDTINYAWSSTGAVSAKSSYTTDTPSCGQTTNGPFAWSPSTLSGTLSAAIAACGAGHTYTFTYTVTDANGQTASSQVTVKVLGPLVISSTSHIVVMAYEAWWGPTTGMNAWLAPTAGAAGYHPLLTSTNVTVGYDSQDPLIIDQHMQWMEELGIDAVTGEQTNGGPCDFGDAQMCARFIAPQSSDGVPGFTASIHAINQGALNLYPALTQRGSKIKIIPVADGADALMYEPRGDGYLPFDVQLAQFYSYTQQYPNENVIYYGKPLLLVFLGAGQDVNDPNSVFNKARAAAARWQDKFTIRLLAGYLDSQPLLWSGNTKFGAHEVIPNYSVWTWTDRLNPAYNLFPSYTVDSGNNVEAFTVTSAAPSTNASNFWGGADVTLYRSGATLGDFFNYAKELKPLFLFVNQFNEYTPPDQGIDIEHSNDVEPTKEWGYAKFNKLKEQLQGYRAAVK